MLITESTEHIVHQIQSILTQLSDEQYSSNLDIFNGASIGSHIRHIFDFYNCISLSMEGGQLDYNCRERNAGIQTEKQTALSAFHQVTSLLKFRKDGEELEIVTDFSLDDDDHRPVVKSTIGRELMYAYDHAVHHLAIIKMGIKATYPEVILDAHIGVAPSTIKYQSKN